MCHTTFKDTAINEASRQASVCFVHGIAQCSDDFLEVAMQMALNGLEVHLVDLEGSGYTAGYRCTKLTIERMHHQVATALQ